MSLELYARVLWRFRVIVACGFMLAVLLAGASIVRMQWSHGTPNVSYRQAETWRSTATVFITQAGFPEGRTTLPGTGAPTPGAAGTGNTSSKGKTVFAEPGRLSNLSLLYAQLANSDPVQREVRAEALRRGLAPSKVTAVAVQEVGVGPLPLLSFQGAGGSAAEAKATTATAVDAFKRWIERSQSGADILPQDRVALQVLKEPRDAVIAAGRKKTLPLTIFMTVLLASCGFVFILENLRPTATKRRDDYPLGGSDDALAQGSPAGVSTRAA